jgi:hypothetical protein
MISGPQTARQHNQPLTGESESFTTTVKTVAERRDKIEKCLRRFVRDEILIRLMATELLKVVQE